MPAEKWAYFLTNLKSKGGADTEGFRLVGLRTGEGEDLLEVFFERPREISVVIESGLDDLLSSLGLKKFSSLLLKLDS